MVQILGWLSTALVLMGFILNAKKHLYWAFIAWIIGDIGWIVYDVLINNYSHMTLSVVIIAINGVGLYKNDFNTGK